MGDGKKCWRGGGKEGPGSRRKDEAEEGPKFSSYAAAAAHRTKLLAPGGPQRQQLGPGLKDDGHRHAGDSALQPCREREAVSFVLVGTGWGEVWVGLQGGTRMVPRRTRGSTAQRALLWRPLQPHRWGRSC